MKNEQELPEFWETSFTEKREMWGFEPAQSALNTRDLFLKEGIHKVLIPGIGYGRNASAFMNSGMEVTGIEISKTAIELAYKHYGEGLNIYHGSVTDMPVNDQQYDGIFCHALLHLLDSDERANLISDCYHQLTENGIMVFTVISKQASTYRQGTEISTDRYEMFGGVKMFFYDRISIAAEFSAFGLTEVQEITENYPFFLIECRKTHRY